MKDPKRVAAGRKSRNKGRRSEQELSRVIGEHFGYLTDTKYKEHPNYFLNFIKRTARDRQAKAGDIWLAPDLKEKFKFTIESKDHEGWDFGSFFSLKVAWLEDWWSQAVEQNEGTSYSPLLCFKRNRIPWMCCIRFDDLPHPHLPHTYLLTSLKSSQGTSDCVIMGLETFLHTYYVKTSGGDLQIEENKNFAVTGRAESLE